MALLYAQPNRLLPRDQVIARVWRPDRAEGVTDETMDALASRVRKRIREMGAQREYIITVRGQGFKFVPQP